MANERPKYTKGVFLHSSRLSGLSFGLMLVGVGLILLLDHMGIAPASNIFGFFWPAIWIFFGLQGVFSRRAFGITWGIFFTLMGMVLLLSKLNYIHVRFAVIWPLALIYWGLWMAARAFGVAPRWESLSWVDQTAQSAVSDSVEPKLDISVVFSSVKRRITSRNFTGGKLAAVFAEIVIDLTQAEIEGDEAVIHADGVFGACEIHVPETWQVSARGSAVFGEYADQTQERPPEGTGAKHLIVKGGAVFGSVVIKN